MSLAITIIFVVAAAIDRRQTTIKPGGVYEVDSNDSTARALLNDLFTCPLRTCLLKISSWFSSCACVKSVRYAEDMHALPVMLCCVCETLKLCRRPLPPELMSCVCG
jgi:hypothetical protein